MTCNAAAVSINLALCSGFSDIPLYFLSAAAQVVFFFLPALRQHRSAAVPLFLFVFLFTSLLLLRNKCLEALSLLALLQACLNLKSEVTKLFEFILNADSMN